MFVCLFSINLEAKEVNKQTAEKVAINAFAGLDNNKNNSGFQVKEILTVKSEEETSFYIINFKPTGFIIVSASNTTIPILGSSTESNFSLENLPPQLNYLLNSYKTQIREIEKQKISPTKEIKQKWDKYAEVSGITSNSLKSASTTLSAVSPLIQTQWGQGAGWNRFCPGNPAGPDGHCKVGCTAVALAQVLKYWGCQVNESGTIVDSNFNNLSVNLTESDYSWGSMGLTSSDNYNARLLYDCALTVQANFGPYTTTGNESEILPALVNNYGFKNTILEESSSWYPSDNIDWIVKLKNELNSGRPIIYSALDPSEGAHTWVIDGYDSNDAFHCNWGWPEYNKDGFFPITVLNPGIYNFSMYHWAITNIEPVMQSCEGINGGDVACASFDVNSPPGATVTWETSTNITTVSSQPSNPCTFQANGTASGPGWIEATVHNNGNATLDRKTVWVGTPIVTSVTGASPLGVYQPATYYAELSSFSSLPDSYSWATSPSSGVTITSYGHYASIMFTRSGWYQVVAKAHNACGWSSYAMKMVNVISGYSMAISPNPATGETTVELVNDNKEVLALLTEWDYEIYDSMQSLKEKKTKLKAAQTKVNTTSWKDGVYIVRAKIGDEVITEKLIVKH